MKDLESFIEECSALANKKDLLEIYNMAVEVPYSFLYVKLNAKSKKDMFYINFSKRIEIDN